MSPSPHITVRIDLLRIRQNVQAIARSTGVPVIAVLKADAYGLGADAVAAAIGDLVHGFYVFNLAEAVQAKIQDITKRPTIALLNETKEPDDYISRNIHPVVWTIEQAKALKKALPVLSVDIGQGRFGCPPREVRSILAAGDIHEAMTHAITRDQAAAFLQCMNDQSGGANKYFKHAAGSSLLNDPSAWMEAVRPGLALYRDAVRVSTRLIEVKDSTGPSGYTGFTVPRFGLILAGYSNGLRPGPCVVSGTVRRLIETGMQSSFVELGPKDRVGDEVVLLGEGLTVEAITQKWDTTPHEALLRLASSGLRTY